LKKDGFGGAGGEGFVEGDEARVGLDGEGGEVGVGPAFGRGNGGESKVAEAGLESWGLGEEDCPAFAEKKIVHAPCLSLREDFIAHDGNVRQKAQKAELGEAAEEKLLLIDGIEPGCCPRVVRVQPRRESQPYVDIGKKTSDHGNPIRS